MQMLMKNPKFLLPALGLLVAWIGLSLHAPMAQTGSAQGSRASGGGGFWATQLQDPMIKGQLLPDDGFAAAIFFGGNVMGNLEVCG